MQTSKWGPSSWHTFFIYSRNYPEKYNPLNSEHRIIRYYTKNFYESLKFILPCKYCRESYKKYYDELPIDNYLHGRDALTYWLYLIKDKVNQKLISQEIDKYYTEKNKYKKRLTYKEDLELRKRIFVTKPSPPFKTVIAKYEKFRSTCNKN